MTEGKGVGWDLLLELSSLGEYTELGWEYASSVRSMARELLALREINAELLEALKGWQDHLAESLNCMDAKEQALFFAGKRAIQRATGGGSSQS